MSFVPRLTRPEADNKYYIRKSSGGYNGAVKGSPTDPDCNVLSNCVGYAVGRFNEIGGWGKCKYLSPVNAEQFMQIKGSLESGMEPRVGACMVWRGGPTLSGSDGAGHVAIVERVISGAEVVMSDSAYGGAAFRLQTRRKGSDGNWGQGNTFKFLGFIYNPAPCCNEPEPEKEDGMTYYEKLGNVPGSYQPTIRKLMERGALKGYSDPDPNSLEDNVINVSEDYCRVMTTLDRMGKLD